MIQVGQRVKFDPFGSITGFASEDNKGNYVAGTVVFVNARNKWFSVEYGYPIARTSFKFCDIGKEVKICG
jgi:hypothetical protein